jgi:hypothetical protein
MTYKRIAVVVRMFVLFIFIPGLAHAAAVGRFTLVKGQVDLLKQGKIPAIPAKLQDGVEAGDVVRTKANAKAQLTMVDDSVLTLAPETRLAIADYQFQAARGERRAVLRLFRGLLHTVVNRVIKTEEPDFIVETHTAVIGVRGTDWYTLLGPNFTSAYLARGILGISSNLPTIPALLLMEGPRFTQIPLGKQPYLAQSLTPEILKMLQQLMDTGLKGGGLGFGLPAPEGSQGEFPLGLPTTPDQRIRQETIPPVLVPRPQTPAPVQPAPSHSPGGSGYQPSP